MPLQDRGETHRKAILLSAEITGALEEAVLLASVKKFNVFSEISGFIWISNLSWTSKMKPPELNIFLSMSVYDGRITSPDL